MTKDPFNLREINDQMLPQVVHAFTLMQTECLLWIHGPLFCFWGEEGGRDLGETKMISWYKIIHKRFLQLLKIWNTSKL